MTEMSHTERFKTISRVNWVCTIIDAVLTVFKLSIGFLAKSPALIADALHSLSDLGTDVLALVLGNLAKHGPDEDHPYGHARYETMGTAVLGTVLMMVALGIGVENLMALLNGESTSPHWLALVAVAVSIVSKEALFHYTMKYARLTRSNLLEANAWHSRSDSLSSVVVFVGIICSLAGLHFVEYLAALGVAALIGKMGYQLAWEAMQDLIDRGVSTEQQQAYMDTLNSVEDIIDVHMLRSRLMGTDVLIDGHIQVAPTLTVSEAHQINDFATRLLKQNHAEITDITLHIDFEPDHRIEKTKLKPMRKTIEHLLSDFDLPDYERLYLHYSDNLLNIEIVFAANEDVSGVNQKLEELIQNTDWINSIEVHQKIG